MSALPMPRKKLIEALPLDAINKVSACAVIFA